MYTSFPAASMGHGETVKCVTRSPGSDALNDVIAGWLNTQSRGRREIMGRKSFNECSLIDKLPVMGLRLRLSLAIAASLMDRRRPWRGPPGDDGAPVPRGAVTRPRAEPLQPPAESRGVWPGCDHRPCQVDG